MSLSGGNIDSTIIKERVKHFRFLMREYEQIKAGSHGGFRFVGDFYKYHNIKRQNFIKYYNRYKYSGQDSSLLPAKRGPKWKKRRIPGFIEERVKELRQEGLNRYEIYIILKEKYDKYTPSPSSIYNISKRYKLNVLKRKMKQNRRKIIKEKAGEMGHMDCYYLPKGTIGNNSKKYYLVAIIDACTRVAWADLVEDITALRVMFTSLKMINLLNSRYNIKFKDILTDNGREFRGTEKNHPFEVMLTELDIKHRYTRPYRPQTNGKIERFWKTLKADMLEDTEFKDEETFKRELLNYLVYYNEHRPHTSIGGQAPNIFNKSCHRIT